jgi:hypothetical protein
MTVRVVVAIGFAALLAGLTVTLAQSAPRQAGSNNVIETDEVARLEPRGSHCQEDELIPKDAAKLQLRVGTNGRPAPAIRVTVRGGDGRQVTAGRLPAGAREGYVAIPVRQVGATTPGTRVCIHVGGARTVLYGQASRIRLDWLRPGNESWFALIPVVAHRFALGKASLFGSLWLVVIALVMVAAAAIAVRAVLREVTARP